MNRDSHAYLLLPRIRIEGLNAISSPITWGFPALTAFTGAIHALQRQMQAAGELEGAFDAVAISCHRFSARTRRNRDLHRFSLARHPLDEHGDTASIFEEGKADAEVSLLIRVTGGPMTEVLAEAKALAARTWERLHGIRLAGGVPRAHPGNPEVDAWLGDLTASEAQKTWHKMRRKLAPGNLIVSREGLLLHHLARQRQSDPTADGLKALLDILALHNQCEVSDSPEEPNDQAEPKISWTRQKRYRGWLVPIPIGYAGISELHPPGIAKNARDPTVPFQFVESLITLGEWRSPFKVERVEHALWQHQHDSVNHIYRCANLMAHDSSMEGVNP